MNGEEDTGGGAVASLTLVASDGFPVSATRFKATGPARGVMLVAPGIGFRQSYYADFAGHFASRGWDVLTWDWRGTGSSRHGVSPRDPRLDLARWATEDLAAAIAWADRRSAGSRVILVGHSFGGHAVGLSHNADRLDAVVLVASQHGWLGHWPLGQRLYLVALWCLVVPSLSRLLGRFPSRWFGLGEELPEAAARQWARWCRSRDYHGEWQGYSRMAAPMLALSFSDDPVAPHQAMLALLARFTDAVRLEHQHITPASVGRQSIGHLGFFRPWAATTLWSRVASFLDGLPGTVAAARDRD